MIHTPIMIQLVFNILFIHLFMLTKWMVISLIEVRLNHFDVRIKYQEATPQLSS